LVVGVEDGGVGFGQRYVVEPIILHGKLGLRAASPADNGVSYA
jgi:hypothetical protein